MPRVKTVSDDEFVAVFVQGASQAAAARRLSMSPAQVSRRYQELKERIAAEASSPLTPNPAAERQSGAARPAPAQSKPVSTKPADQLAELEVSIWDTESANEENYRAILVLRDKAVEAKDKMKAISLAMQCRRFMIQAAEQMYNMRAMKTFMDEVVADLNELAPGHGDLVVQRFRERIALRSASSVDRSEVSAG